MIGVIWNFWVKQKLGNAIQSNGILLLKLYPKIVYYSSVLRWKSKPQGPLRTPFFAKEVKKQPQQKILFLQRKRNTFLMEETFLGSIFHLMRISPLKRLQCWQSLVNGNLFLFFILLQHFSEINNFSLTHTIEKVLVTFFR